MEARKRVFLIVLDSVGIGAAPDAPEYGDEGILAGTHRHDKIYRDPLNT